MMRWGLYIPVISLLFILYFQYLDILFRGKFAHAKIEPDKSLNPRKFEYTYTFVTFLIYALVGLIVGYCIDRNITQVYPETSGSLSGVCYLPISLFIALGIHDLYFYFTHRLLHSKHLFKHVHSWHHRSQPTNSWSAFSFHPLEALLQISIVPLIVFVLPIHETVLFLFVGFLLFISVYGHSGFELRAGKRKLFDIFNTSLHHYQHHQFVHVNFGIYLNIWDKLFSTNYREYSRIFKTLSERIRSQQKPTHPIRDAETKL